MGEDNEARLVAEQLILGLWASNIVFLLRITAAAIQRQTATEQHLFRANIIIHQCVAPTRTCPLTKLRDAWLRPEVAPMRLEVKYSTSTLPFISKCCRSKPSGPQSCFDLSHRT
jgi:hypothetical protein